MCDNIEEENTMPFKEVNISKIIEEKCKNDFEFKIALREVNNMILCNEECEPMCDFCLHLKKNPEDGGESWCEVMQEMVDWCDSCCEFWCKYTKEE